MIVDNEAIANDEITASQKQNFQNSDNVLNLENFDNLEETEIEAYKYSNAKGEFTMDYHRV